MPCRILAPIGLLVSSSELPEVMGISDRVLVMREGQIVANVPREEFSEQTLLQYALPDAGTLPREEQQNTGNANA